SSPLPSAGAENGLIKVVLPLPPGGAGDIIARLLTDQVGRLNHRSFTIETRPGAGTMIGTEAVARAAADGKTLLINAPYLLIGPHLRKLTFDPAHRPRSRVSSRQLAGRARRQRGVALCHLRRSHPSGARSAGADDVRER